MANMNFANNANTTLASALTAIATSMSVTSATTFPVLTGAAYFYCTLTDVATQTVIEIVKVTATSGTTWTIARGQDGTTGTAFAAGDVVSLRLVRASLDNFPKLDEVNTFTSVQTFSSQPILSSLTASSAVATNASKGLVSVTNTGSGNNVLATSPTLTTPTIGVATATSINKMAITAPATSSTLAVADGKTLTASNTLTLAGTDSTTMTFPTTSATIARTDASNTFTGIQTFDVAQNSQVDIVVVTNTTVKTFSATDVQQWLCIASDLNASTSYAVGIITTTNGTYSVINLAQGGDYLAGWNMSGANLRLTSVGGGSNCRASFLRIR